MGDILTRYFSKLGADQMAWRANARRGVIPAPRLRAHPRGKLRQIIDPGIGAHGNDQRQIADPRDGREIIDGIKGQAAIKGRVH